jgi:Major Facilitator Superfamily
VSKWSKVLYLYAARAARGFGDGFAAIILPAYLIEIGFSPLQIGVVATAALLGSAATTLAVGVLAPRYGLRTLLLACAALMILTGLAIPNLHHLVLLAAIAFIGTINPTTGDIGVHVPLEQAALAQDAADRERTRIFARYSLVGALSIAVGALAAGADRRDHGRGLVRNDRPDRRIPSRTVDGLVQRRRRRRPFGALYLRIVGPVYLCFGLGLGLFFVTQGVGRRHGHEC